MANNLNQPDVEYVNTIYQYVNAKPSLKANLILFSLLIFFASFIIWASISEIDEIARGEGKVIPSNKIQTIQNLDGGIISEIMVKEGEDVKMGAPLIKIDTTRFQASVDENQNEYFRLLADSTRLQAESKINVNQDIGSLSFPIELVDDDLKALENRIFMQRVDELKSSLKVLETQFGQKVQELQEIKGRQSQLESSLKVIKQQYETMQKLFKSGIKSKYDLLNSEKEMLTTQGELEAAKLSIPRANLAISEAENKIKEKVQNFRAEAANELQTTLGELRKFQSKLVAEEDKLAKTVITSPVDGNIKSIKINTVGGVIKSGMDLIEIVPTSETLLVEAKIDPKDIAFINPSQKAIVKITAYDFSIYGGLEGKIVEISADSIKDEDSKEGKSYYKVVIKTEKNHLEKDGKKLPIIPGMIASVDIITGKKTIMDFILKPILKTKQEAFHER